MLKMLGKIDPPPPLLTLHIYNGVSITGSRTALHNTPISASVRRRHLAYFQNTITLSCRRIHLGVNARPLNVEWSATGWCTAELDRVAGARRHSLRGDGQSWSN